MLQILSIHLSQYKRDILVSLLHTTYSNYKVHTPVLWTLGPLPNCPTTTYQVMYNASYASGDLVETCSSPLDTTYSAKLTQKI